MSDATRWARPLLSFAIIAATVLGLLNVYSDNTAVKGQARRVACGGKECDAPLTREERTPFGQSFLYHPKGGSVDVKCARQFILLGDYECVKR